jgi:hypothetical protein
MAPLKAKKTNGGKKHGGKARKVMSRSSSRNAAKAVKSKVREGIIMRKLDLKKRGARVRAKQMHMEAARLSCVARGIGAVKYLNPDNDVQQLPNCPLTMKDKSRLAANIKSGSTPRRGEHMQHLTDAEEHDVAVEMVKCAHARNPRTWRSMEEVVAETISNRANGPAGRAFTRPTIQGAKAARNGRCGFKWRHSFIGRNNMKDFAPEDLGQSRARACNEFAMQEHLQDLRAELIDCGIMVSVEEPRITDNRRIINMDEIPQVMNARANAGNAKERVGGGGHQTRVYQQAGEGRTCNTVDVAYDLGGYLYGPHILLARTTLDTNVIDERELKKEYHYNNKVDEQMAMSWVFDITTCECGIQTQVTLAKRIASIRQQIVDRNTACLLEGEEPIQFPVVMLLDNHSSRFGSEVHDALFFVQEEEEYGLGCWARSPRGLLSLPFVSEEGESSDSSDSEFDPDDDTFVACEASATFERNTGAMEFKDGRGEQVIRMFSEPPNTSTFLQAVDQIGKQFHAAYDKRKVSFMKTT